jgi:hypothetical protein
MYHLQVLEDLATLAALSEDRELRSAVGEKWGAAADYAAWMRHPDGGIPLFNDATLDGSRPPEATLALGRLSGLEADSRPRQGPRHFADAGMVIWHGTPWSVFFDVGPVGPDYQPGHGHADTLSVECSHGGRRLYVDPGTYAYDLDARRAYDRSTAAHNTVCVDGQDSSEVWHIFRVGRRAAPLGVRVEPAAGGLRAEAAHNGYDHLPGRPRHTRRLAVAEGGPLSLSDRVEGRGEHTVEGGLLLAPDWQATPAAGGWLLQGGPARLRVQVRGPAGLGLVAEQRPYHPEFGRELQTTRLTWRLRGSLPVEITTLTEEA